MIDNMHGNMYNLNSVRVTDARVACDRESPCGGSLFSKGG